MDNLIYVKDKKLFLKYGYTYIDEIKIDNEKYYIFLDDGKDDGNISKKDIVRLDKLKNTLFL